VTPDELAKLRAELDEARGELARFRQREVLVQDLLRLAKDMKQETFARHVPEVAVNELRQTVRDIANFDLGKTKSFTPSERAAEIARLEQILLDDMDQGLFLGRENPLEPRIAQLRRAQALQKQMSSATAARRWGDPPSPELGSSALCCVGCGLTSFEEPSVKHRVGIDGAAPFIAYCNDCWKKVPAP